MTTRAEARAQGELIRESLLKVPYAAHIPADVKDLLSEVVFRGVWSRPGLARQDRMICSLAALCVTQRLTPLRQWVLAGLDAGLDPRAIQEICLHVCYYIGLVAVEDTLRVVHDAFAERQCPLPPAVVADGTLEELAAQGNRVKELLHSKGEAHRAPDEGDVVNALFHLAAPYAYGAVWNRPGLDYRARTLTAIAAFTAMRMEEQVRLFSRAGLKLGLSRTEVVEAIVQTGPFSGFPGAIQALRILAKMLAEEPGAAP